MTTATTTNATTTATTTPMISPIVTVIAELEPPTDNTYYSNWVWWKSNAVWCTSSSQLDSSCPKTWLSAKDCTRRVDGRKTDTRKTKKKDVGPTHGARGQEDQLPGVEEKSWRPDTVASSSTEPALGQSTQEEEVIVNQLLGLLFDQDLGFGRLAALFIIIIIIIIIIT